jgi:EAL domain-containing protein (putative c-di-GMP-specific phosphodiesterase class I)
MGCRDAQGFLFARPMDLPELGAWLQAFAWSSEQMGLTQS